MNDIPAIAEHNRRVVEHFLAGTHAPDLSGLSVIDETVDPSIRGYGFPGGLDPVDLESYKQFFRCLLYTSPSPRDKRQSRMPSSA